MSLNERLPSVEKILVYFASFQLLVPLSWVSFSVAKNSYNLGNESQSKFLVNRIVATVWINSDTSYQNDLFLLRVLRSAWTEVDSKC